jgi:hypothetical protein
MVAMEAAVSIDGCPIAGVRTCRQSEVKWMKYETNPTVHQSGERRFGVFTKRTQSPPNATLALLANRISLDACKGSAPSSDFQYEDAGFANRRTGYNCRNAHIG